VPTRPPFDPGNPFLHFGDLLDSIIEHFPFDLLFDFVKNTLCLLGGVIKYYVLIPFSHDLIKELIEIDMSFFIF